MLGVIVGTGLNQLAALAKDEGKLIDTPYGLTSGELLHVELLGERLVLLPRHGRSHSVPPHLINYRANIWALKDAGVSDIVAFAAVGGISAQMSPGSLVLPDQIVDYTYGRKQTFFEENFSPDQHIDFTYPYTQSLRKKILQAANKESIRMVEEGVYACTQGPRLETAAEIKKLARDLCDIVGMTAMPEAALAKEQNVNYATIAIVVNWAAGLTEDIISMDEIKKIAGNAEESLVSIISGLLKA